MRKLMVILSIFMFVTTATATASYTGLYKSGAEENYAGGIYSNRSGNSEEEDSGFGIFRSSEPDPGGRPGSGGGIGQEDGKDVPSGDGLMVLIACSLLLIVGKLLAKKLRRATVSKVFLTIMSLRA